MSPPSPIAKTPALNRPKERHCSLTTDYKCMHIISLDQRLAPHILQKWLEQLIRRSWWGYEDAFIRYSPFSLRATQPLARTIEHVRLSDAIRLIHLLQAQDLSVYANIILQRNKTFRAVLPPVVEASPEGLLIMDGMHRIMAARLCRMRTIWGLIVTCANHYPPPIVPCPWSDVTIVDRRLSRDENFPGHSPDVFRSTAEFLDRMTAPCDTLAESLDNLNLLDFEVMLDW